MSRRDANGRDYEPGRVRATMSRGITVGDTVKLVGGGIAILAAVIAWGEWKGRTDAGAEASSAEIERVEKSVARVESRHDADMVAVDDKLDTLLDRSARQETRQEVLIEAVRRMGDQ